MYKNEQQQQQQISPLVSARIFSRYSEVRVNNLWPDKLTTIICVPNITYDKYMYLMIVSIIIMKLELLNLASRKYKSRNWKVYQNSDIKRYQTRCRFYQNQFEITTQNNWIINTNAF